MSFYDSTARCLGCLAITLCAGVLGCSPRATVPSPPAAGESLEQSSSVSEAIQLYDVTPQTGITFVHSDGSYGKYLLPETMSGGLALFDYDNDGLTDILFCNGIPLDPDSSPSEQAGRGAVLYRNLGNLRFLDTTLAAGLHNDQFGVGVTVADFDNDGFADIFLSNFGPNRFFHNTGAGSFEEVDLDGQQPARFSAGASFVDADGDGNLDLFVANYVRLSWSDLEHQAKLGRSIYPSPQDFHPESNQLFINSGDGGWVDASLTWQLDRFSGTGMGCVTGDFDGDGNTDIYVANDELPNSLLLNTGQGVFEEAALQFGVAVDSRGQAAGSMGVDAGDLDRDGRCDLIITSFENEAVNLYQATAQQLYQDVARASDIAMPSVPPVTWGCCMSDFELDGDLDLFLATGHLDQRSPGNYKLPNLIFKNLYGQTSQLRFEDVTHRSGDTAAHAYSSRGAGVADLDNDGDQDVVVLNVRDQASLFENRSLRGGNHWLQVRLIGRSCNRDAVGARVRVVADQLELVDEVRNGRGYQSYWGDRLHFGLGESLATHVRLEIAWPDGEQQAFDSVSVDQIITLVQ